MQDFFVVRFLQGSRATLLAWACVLIAAIALVDWHFENDVSFGFLYLFPMLMVGGCLRRWQIAIVAAVCTGLTEAFDPFPWVMAEGLSRVILTFAAFFATGYFGFASARSRRLADQHLREIENESELRRKTEEQLEFLISSSPATIFTLDASGNVLLANEAAHRLLRVDDTKLQGRPIAEFFPALATVPPTRDDAPSFHTEMECRGRRQDGDVFLAHVWFSTYQTKSGPRLAAVVFDTSEELRDRAEFNLQQILTGSKVLVAALCHEIRNVCGAIAVVHSKLARDERLSANEDFRALGTLVQGLEKMAGLELRQTTQSVAESADVRSGIGGIADCDRAILSRVRYEHLLGYPRSCPASLGGQTSVAAGVSESHQEQPASHGGSRSQRTGRARFLRCQFRHGAVYRLRPGRRQSGAIIRALPARRPGQRIGTLSFAHLRPRFSGRHRARAPIVGVLFCRHSCAGIGGAAWSRDSFLMAKIQLLLLDDHTLFRAMLSRLLETESDFRVVANCSSSAEALDALGRNQVDLVLLDYDLGNRQTGLQFAREVREARYTSRIFIVTAGMNDADYVRALGLGVCGIFLKHSPPEMLIEAIRKVMAGETWIDPRCVQGLVKAVESEGRNARKNQLSERERDVLKGVFSGFSNKEIAAQLSISEASVKSALQQLFVKTGVRTRSQLVRIALEDSNTWGLR